MFFISLSKWKQPPTTEMRAQMDQATKKLEEIAKQGIKVSVYWTLGRYDVVSIIEARSEKDAMKILLGFQHIIDTETMVAVPREEAIKLL